MQGNIHFGHLLGKPKQCWIQTAVISAGFCFQTCERQVPVEAWCVLIVRKAGCDGVWYQVLVHNCSHECGV